MNSSFKNSPSSTPYQSSHTHSKRTIGVLASAAFLNDLGADMIFSIWPLYVTGVLGANMIVMGLIDGLSDAIVSISQAISGYFSDKIRKRKIFVWLGYLFAGSGRLGYAFVSTWQQIIPFRVLDRSGKIRGAPRDAIIADISAKEERGKNFGILRGLDHLGAVAGVSIAVFLLNDAGYRNLFLIAAIPSLIGALLILFLVIEVRPPQARNNQPFSLKMINPNFRLFIFLSAIFALGSFSYSFLMIFAKHFGFKETFIPILYLIYSLFAGIFAMPFGRLADRWGRKKVLLLSYGFWLLTCLFLLISQNYLVIILGFILFGLHEGALEPVQKSIVSELAPEEYRASSLGIFQIVVGFCALPASLMAGMLWEKIGIFTPFYISIALTVIAILLLIFVKDGKKH